MDLRDGRNNVPAGPAEQVFFDQNTPTTGGVIFDPNTPATTDTLYVSSTNGSTWIYNGSAYVTYTAPAVQSTPFYISGTAIDAGSNKTAIIQRSGEVRIVNSILARFRVNSGTRGILIASDAALNPGITSVGQDFVVGTTDARDLIFKTNSVERIRAASGGAIRFNSAYTFPTADGTANQVLKTNGAGVLTFGDASSAVPQANKIYVDSVNGVNSTGRGNINTPYLTPEYALSDITNTGTFTCNTATNVTLSAISDVNNALIKVGDYITGTGIPFGTQVRTKQNEGGNANTITLTKATTATATGITATRVTFYIVELSGTFNATGNYHKVGFIPDWKTNNATVIIGNQVLFTLTANVIVPMGFLAGNTYGTHANSGLIESVTFSAIDIDIDYGNYYSIGTGFQIGSPIATAYLNCTNFRAKGKMFDARFGSVSFINATAIFEWYGDAYGLLGGVRNNGGAKNEVNGIITTPASIVAILLIGESNVYGTVTGSVTLTGTTYANINVYATIVGTTTTVGSGGIENVTLHGNIIGNIVNTSPLKIIGCVVGNITNNGATVGETSCLGRVNGTVTCSSGTFEFLGTQVGTHSSNNMTVVIGNGNFVNKGGIRLVLLTYTGTGRFTNDGEILTFGATNTSAPIRITNGGKFINNGDLTVTPEIDICPIVEKTDGVFVNNGRMYNPFNMYVKCVANTSVSKDIVLAYAMSNGNVNGNSTSGTGEINKFSVTSANTNTILTVNDGTNSVVISVTGAGKSVAVISAEIVTLIQASILLFQNCSYSSTYGVVYFVPRAGFTATFTVTTNISSIGTYAGGGGFAGNALGGGTELFSSSFNY